MPIPISRDQLKKLNSMQADMTAVQRKELDEVNRRATAFGSHRELYDYIQKSGYHAGDDPESVVRSYIDLTGYGKGKPEPDWTAEEYNQRDVMEIGSQYTPQAARVLSPFETLTKEFFGRAMKPDEAEEAVLGQLKNMFGPQPVDDYASMEPGERAKVAVDKENRRRKSLRQTYKPAGTNEPQLNMPGAEYTPFTKDQQDVSPDDQEAVAGAVKKEFNEQLEQSPGYVFQAAAAELTPEQEIMAAAVALSDDPFHVWTMYRDPIEAMNPAQWGAFRTAVFALKPEFDRNFLERQGGVFGMAEHRIRGLGRTMKNLGGDLISFADNSREITREIDRKIPDAFDAAGNLKPEHEQAVRKIIRDATKVERLSVRKGMSEKVENYYFENLPEMVSDARARDRKDRLDYDVRQMTGTTRYTDLGAFQEGLLNVEQITTDMLSVAAVSLIPGVGKPAALALTYGSVQSDWEDRLRFQYDVAPETARLISGVFAIPYALSEYYEVKYLNPATWGKGTADEGLKLFTGVRSNPGMFMHYFGQYFRRGTWKELKEEYIQSGIEFAAMESARVYAENNGITFSGNLQNAVQDAVQATLYMPFVTLLGGGAIQTTKAAVKGDAGLLLPPEMRQMSHDRFIPEKAWNESQTWRKQFNDLQRDGGLKLDRYPRDLKRLVRRADAAAERPNMDPRDLQALEDEVNGSLEQGGYADREKALSGIRREIEADDVIRGLTREEISVYRDVLDRQLGEADETDVLSSPKLSLIESAMSSYGERLGVRLETYPTQKEAVAAHPELETARGQKIKALLLPDGKTVVIIEENIQNAADGAEQFFHEVFGHRGLDLNPRAERLFDDLKSTLDLNFIRSQLPEFYRDKSAETVMEEYLSRLVAKAARGQELSGEQEKGVWSRFGEWAGRELGLTPDAAMRAQDTARLALDVLNFSKNYNSQYPDGTEVKLNRRKYRRSGGRWVNSKGQAITDAGMVQEIETEADAAAQKAEVIKQKERKKAAEDEIRQMADQDPVIQMVQENGGVRMPDLKPGESYPDEYQAIPARFRGKKGGGLPLDELADQVAALSGQEAEYSTDELRGHLEQFDDKAQRLLAAAERGEDFQPEEEDIPILGKIHDPGFDSALDDMRFSVGSGDEMNIRDADGKIDLEKWINLLRDPDIRRRINDSCDRWFKERTGYRRDFVHNHPRVLEMSEKLHKQYGFEKVLGFSDIDEMMFEETLANQGWKIISKSPITPSGTFVGTFYGGEVEEVEAEHPTEGRKFFYVLPERNDIDSFGETVLKTNRAINHKQYLDLFKRVTGRGTWDDDEDTRRQESLSSIKENLHREFDKMDGGGIWILRYEADNELKKLILGMDEKNAAEIKQRYIEQRLNRFHGYEKKDIAKAWNFNVSNAPTLTFQSGEGKISNYSPSSQKYDFDMSENSWEEIPGLWQEQFRKNWSEYEKEHHKPAGWALDRLRELYRPLFESNPENHLIRNNAWLLGLTESSEMAEQLKNFTPQPLEFEHDFVRLEHDSAEKFDEAMPFLTSFAKRIREMSGLDAGESQARFSVGSGDGYEFNGGGKLAADIVSGRVKRPLPEQQILPDEGTYPAVRTDDGGIYVFKAPQTTHVIEIKKAGIPPERIVSGGWIKDGVYDASYRSDTSSYVQQYKAQIKVAAQRYKDSRFSVAPPVDTPEFKKWFGDSKVVDEHGNPLVVFHATYNDFSIFDRSRLGENTEGNASSAELLETAKLGFWFSTKPLAKNMAPSGSDMPVYLAIENPYTTGSLDSLAMETSEAGGANNLVDDLERRGFDGIKISDEEFGGDSYVVFLPEQIKSVYNMGTWDADNPDIRFSMEQQSDPYQETAVHVAGRIYNRDFQYETIKRGKRKGQMVERPQKDQEAEVAALLKGQGASPKLAGEVLEAAREIALHVETDRENLTSRRLINRAIRDEGLRQQFRALVRNAYRKGQQGGEYFESARAHVEERIRRQAEAAMRTRPGLTIEDLEDRYGVKVKDLLDQLELEEKKDVLKPRDQNIDTGEQGEVHGESPDLSPGEQEIYKEPAEQYLHKIKSAVIRSLLREGAIDDAGSFSKNLRNPVVRSEYVETLKHVLLKTSAELNYGFARDVIERGIRNIGDATLLSTIDNRAERLIHRMFDERVRETKEELYQRAETALAGFKGRIKSRQQDISRKVTARIDQLFRFSRKALKVPSELAERRLMELQARVNDLASRAYDGDTDSEAAFEEALDELNAYMRFGAFKYKTTAQMAEQLDWLEKTMADEIEKQEERRAKAAAEAQGIRSRLLAALPNRKHGDDIGRLEKMNSSSQFLEMRLRALPRFGKDADRTAALKDLDALAFDLARANFHKNNRVAEDNRAFGEALREIYGGRPDMILRDLMKPRDEFERFSLYGHKLSRTQLIQMAGMLAQEQYRHAAQLQAEIVPLVEGKKGTAAEIAESLWQFPDDYIKFKTPISEEGMSAGVLEHFVQTVLDGAQLSKQLAMEPEIMKVLTADDMKLLNWFRDYYRRNRPALSDVNDRITGLPIQNPDPYYVPAKIDFERGGMKDVHVSLPVVPPSLSPRVFNARALDEQADIVELYMQRLESNQQYIHFAELHQRVSRIFNDPALLKALRNTHGETTIKQLMVHLRDVISGQPITSGRDPFADALVNIMAATRLGFNVSLTPRQITSLPAFAFYVDTGKFFKYAGSAFSAEGRAAMKTILASPHAKTRLRTGNTQVMNEFLSGFGEKGSTVWEAYKRAGAWPTKIGDIIPTLVFGQGYYRAMIDEAARQGMRPEEGQEWAMDQLWRLVEMSQQSGSMINLAEWQRHGGSFGRALGQFISAPQQYWAKEVFDWREMKAAWQTEGTGSERFKTAGKQFAKTTAINWGVLALLYNGMKLAWYALLGDMPDDKDWQRLLASTAAGPTGGIFIVGAALEAAINGVSTGDTGYGNQLIPLAGILDDAQTAAAIANQLMLGDPEEALDALDRLLRSNLPPYRDVSKAVENYSR